LYEQEARAVIAASGIGGDDGSCLLFIQGNLIGPAAHRWTDAKRLQPVWTHAVLKVSLAARCVGGGGLCMCGRVGGLLPSTRGRRTGRRAARGPPREGADAARAAAQNHPNWRVVVVGSDNCLDTVYYGNQRNMMITNWRAPPRPPDGAPSGRAAHPRRPLSPARWARRPAPCLGRRAQPQDFVEFEIRHRGACTARKRTV